MTSNLGTCHDLGSMDMEYDYRGEAIGDWGEAMEEGDLPNGFEAMLQDIGWVRPLHASCSLLSAHLPASYVLTPLPHVTLTAKQSALKASGNLAAGDDSVPGSILSLQHRGLLCNVKASAHCTLAHVFAFIGGHMPASAGARALSPITLDVPLTGSRNSFMVLQPFFLQASPFAPVPESLPRTPLHPSHMPPASSQAGSSEQLFENYPLFHMVRVDEKAIMHLARWSGQTGALCVCPGGLD
eukprot:scaffold22564_cov18-Tisochrysis_lutea.AAC.1